MKRRKPRKPKPRYSILNYATLICAALLTYMSSLIADSGNFIGGAIFGLIGIIGLAGTAWLALGRG